MLPLSTWEVTLEDELVATASAAADLTRDQAAGK